MSETVEPTKEERQQQQERDSYVKTAILAYVANYWAHNTSISPEQVVAKAVQLADLTWKELVKYRQENGV